MYLQSIPFDRNERSIYIVARKIGKHDRREKPKSIAYSIDRRQIISAILYTSCLSRDDNDDANKMYIR